MSDLWEGSYQGMEFTTTLQANTLRELNSMIKSLEDYAHEYEMDDFKVLSKGPDPDGGYKAIVTAHNWNPLTWIKERWEARGGGPEVRAEKAKTEGKERIARLRAKASAAPSLAREEKRLEIELARARKARVRANGITDLDYAIYKRLKKYYPEVYESFWAEGITIKDLISDFREAMPELYSEISQPSYE